jgi:hypothetical protein
MNDFSYGTDDFRYACPQIIREINKMFTSKD